MATRQTDVPGQMLNMFYGTMLVHEANQNQIKDFSNMVWKACLDGVFPHAVKTMRDPCVRVYAPLTLASPLTKKKTNSNRGWPSSPLEPSEGAFELTHGSACTIGWLSGLPDSLISTYIAQFMGCVIGRIYYGLKVVFCFRQFTAFHYHHYARLLTGTEYIKLFVEYLVEVCLTCC